MKDFALITLTIVLAACSSTTDNAGGSGGSAGTAGGSAGSSAGSAGTGGGSAGTGGGSAGTGGGSGGSSAACTSVSCYVASENTCDDYTMPTAIQCADAPESCTTRHGMLANPAACPTAGFTGKCTMPGPGGYVLRFYGTRGDASDESFCTGIGMGTWSKTF